MAQRDHSLLALPPLGGLCSFASRFLETLRAEMCVVYIASGPFASVVRGHPRKFVFVRQNSEVLPKGVGELVWFFWGVTTRAGGKKVVRFAATDPFCRNANGEWSFGVLEYARKLDSMFHNSHFLLLSLGPRPSKSGNFSPHHVTKLLEFALSHQVPKLAICPQRAA